MTNMRVVLADDHALVRAGIRGLVQQIQGVEVVGEADDGQTALELVAQLVPDIVLMDLSMPGLPGLEATARIHREFPSVRVIVLSMHADREYVLQAVRAGACGYVLKGARAAELEIAVMAVARGESYFSPAASSHLVTDMLRRGSKADVPDRLTPRQKQVLSLLVQGFSRKEIALKLQLSAKTVDTYRAQVMDELGIYDLAGLVRYAIGAGIIEPDSRKPVMTERNE